MAMQRVLDWNQPTKAITAAVCRGFVGFVYQPQDVTS
jgi:hypothetical protein